MQTAPAKANELFARLAETSDGAVKTREKLLAEIKSELELHADLEEQHLFPILRKHPETKGLVAVAIRDNKELRAKLAELDALPKNHETFLEKLAELKKAFRQHARDEKRELLPAVQRALNEDQVQDIAEKMETGMAEAEQIRHDQLEERRAIARQERERAELQAAQEEAEEQEQLAAAAEAREAVTRIAEAAGENARQITKNLGEGVNRVATASAAPLSTGLLFWDMMLGMASRQPTRVGSTPGRDALAAKDSRSEEAVIPLGEEVLTVAKRKVTTGTTRVHRYVVQTPVEQQVSLVHEKVIVERRRPVTDKSTGETLTELTVEVIETAEVPVVSKVVRLKEEVLVRTERTEHVETVRDIVRQDRVTIEHASKRRRLPAAS